MAFREGSEQKQNEQKTKKIKNKTKLMDLSGQVIMHSQSEQKTKKTRNNTNVPDCDCATIQDIMHSQNLVNNFALHWQAKHPTII